MATKKVKKSKGSDKKTKKPSAPKVKRAYKKRSQKLEEIISTTPEAENPITSIEPISEQDKLIEESVKTKEILPIVAPEILSIPVETITPVIPVENTITQEKDFPKILWEFLGERIAIQLNKNQLIEIGLSESELPPNYTSKIYGRILLQNLSKDKFVIRKK